MLTPFRKHTGPLAMLTLLLVADQLSKIWVSTELVLYESREVIPGFFNLVHYTNPGIAFGLLADGDPGWRRFFFIGATALALVLLAVLYRHVRYQGRLYIYALAMITAGAIGNLLDRIRLGEVTDFLDFYWRTHHWPAFNIADSAITIGVLLFFVATWRHPPEEPQVDKVV